MNQTSSYNHIISLGRNCLPRTVLTHAGYKPRKRDGELSLPFDLSIHSYESVCKLLDNDFQDYVNPDYICIDKNKIIHTKYTKVEFTHESIEDYLDFYTQNNFEELILRYQKRIQNFYTYIADNDILFVCNFAHYPNELSGIISRKFPDLRYKIVCLNYLPNLDLNSDQLMRVMIPNNMDDNPNIDYFVLVPPEKNFKWHNARIKNTPLGKKWYGYIDNIFKRYLLKNQKEKK